jgi:hypothetical protein
MRRSVFRGDMRNRSQGCSKPSLGLVGLSVFASLATVVCSISPAFAQAEAAPPDVAPAPPETGVPVTPPGEAPPSQAQPTSDDRPLPPPPPKAASTSPSPGYNPNANYNNSGSPSSYYPQRPPTGVYRPFSFSLGLGPGLLTRKNDLEKTSAGGVAHSVRFGFGVQPNLSVTLGYEGTAVRKNGYATSQSALLVGVQYFVAQVLYLRVGMGIANETDEDDNGFVTDQDGFGFQGVAGVDLIQSSNVSLALEAGLLVGQYAGYKATGPETWSSAGINMVFSLY